MYSKYSNNTALTEKSLYQQKEFVHILSLQDKDASSSAPIPRLLQKGDRQNIISVYQGSPTILVSNIPKVLLPHTSVLEV